jgi:hypothetical protein
MLLDVTQLLSQAGDALDWGELLASPGFDLFNAIHCLPIGSAKMDAGVNSLTATFSESISTYTYIA